MRLLRKPDDAHVQAVMHDVAACFVRVLGEGILEILLKEAHISRTEPLARV